MRPATAVFVAAAMAVNVAGCGQSGNNTAENATVIEHVTVVDPARGEAHPDQSVVILNGRIRQVAPASEVRALTGERVVDGRGKFLLPGLWDMHTHLAGDEPAMERLLARGVVGVRDMGGDFAVLAESRRRVADGRLQGPLLVLAGPFLRGARDAADASSNDSWVVRTADDARREVERLASLGVDFVSTDGTLSRDAYLAVTGAARQRTMRVGGRVPDDVSLAEAAAAGVASIDGPDWMRATPTDLEALARAGVWLTPMLSSSTAPAPQTAGAMTQRLRSLRPDIHRTRVRLLAGSDWTQPASSRGGSPDTALHDELSALVSAGFSTADALRAATSGAAEFLGITNTHGAVAAGRTADLLLLDGNPLDDVGNTRRIVAVIKNGQFRYSHAPAP
jgi:imidazolonepropionase-like amidohydrolase